MTKDHPISNAKLRDKENVRLNESIYDYYAREALRQLPDAWIDPSKKDEKDGRIGIMGYEINFNCIFYKYIPPRKLHVIDADLKQVEDEITALLEEVTK